MTVLDDYQVQTFRQDGLAIEQLVVSRHDGQPITSLADVWAIWADRRPDSDLLHVHLWLHRGAAASENGAASDADQEEDAARAAAERVASVAASVPTPSASLQSAPRARRPRRGGTLNLRDREIAALAEFIDDPFDLDDGSERAESVLAVRAKVARLPVAVSA